jgi:hypothetical protein
MLVHRGTFLSLFHSLIWKVGYHCPNPTLPSEGIKGPAQGSVALCLSQNPALERGTEGPRRQHRTGGVPVSPGECWPEAATANAGTCQLQGFKEDLWALVLHPKVVFSQCKVRDLSALTSSAAVPLRSRSGLSPQSSQ